ncbi:hypothetical protein D4764_20G0009550 [Takifugu flavidus]|uniref:Murine leukemia virus integrase C-terminal domain-containing protein n=1 Tax=Takifugu flavidus TaxID=433684 RepID=A0A5C6NI87_9TELE|nr:hypothetical protein D4764_20G0009550 [Takifugu flavidus]
MPILSQAEAEGVGEAEAEGEEEAIPPEAQLHNQTDLHVTMHVERIDSTPQEPIQPGDYVWVKKFVRKRWNTPRWEGPYQVQLTTKTAVRVDGKLSWIHLSHCKKQKILPGEGEGAVADSP